MPVNANAKEFSTLFLRDQPRVGIRLSTHSRQPHVFIIISTEQAAPSKDEPRLAARSHTIAEHKLS